jgi:ComF family protein
VFGTLLEVLFPARCAGCGSGPWPFCGPCGAALVPLGRPWCERCGAPAARDVPRCRHCPPEAIERARAAFLFDGPARRAIHRLKFSGWRSVAHALGGAMAEVNDLRADVVTWVPLSRRRRAARGFDQARALADVVGPALGLPVVPLVRRTAEAPPQARRAGEARRGAMRGVFEGRGCPPDRVLLVDDVLTTGATAAACAEVLLEAGASAVVVLTAARASSGAMADLYSIPGSRPGLWLPGEQLPGSRSQPRAKRPT